MSAARVTRSCLLARVVSEETAKLPCLAFLREENLFPASLRCTTSRLGVCVTLALVLGKESPLLLSSGHHTPYTLGFQTFGQVQVLGISAAG